MFDTMTARKHTSKINIVVYLVQQYIYYYNFSLIIVMPDK